MKTRKVSLFSIFVRTMLLCLLLFYNQNFALSNDAEAEQLFQKLKELSISDPELAATKVKDYLKFGNKFNNDKISANAYYLLGRINYFQSRNYISNQYYAQALKSQYAKKELSFAESCYNNMGVNYDMMHLFPQALEAYQRSLKSAEQLKDSVSIAESWINIGLLYGKILKYDKSNTFLRNALKFFTKKKNYLNIALCYQNIGFNYSETEYFDKAIEEYNKALFLMRKVGNNFEELNILFNLSSDYLSQGNQFMSQKYQNEVLPLAIAQDRQDILAKINIQKGDNYATNNDFKNAEKQYIAAEKIIDKYEIYKLFALLHKSMKDLYAKSGNYEAYKNTVQKTEYAKHLLRLDEVTVRTDELESLYEFKKNVDKIKYQEVEIRNNTFKVIYLIGGAIVILLVITLLISQYVKTKRYMKSLFYINVEKSTHHLVELESINLKPNFLSDVYQQIIELASQPQNEQLTSLEFSKILGVREENIFQAIRAFRMKNDTHSIFKITFVDDVCKSVLESPRSFIIQDEMIRSPFKDISSFYKSFQDTTGLTYDQFVKYAVANELQGRQMLA